MNSTIENTTTKKHTFAKTSPVRYFNPKKFSPVILAKNKPLDESSRFVSKELQMEILEFVYNMEIIVGNKVSYKNIFNEFELGLYYKNESYVANIFSYNGFKGKNDFLERMMYNIQRIKSRGLKLKRNERLGLVWNYTLNRVEIHILKNT